MEKELVGGASATTDAQAVREASKEIAAVIGDIATKFGNGTLSIEEGKRFARRENPFSPARISKRLRAEWEKFYRDYLGIDADLSGVTVPDGLGDFSRVLVIAQGLTPNIVLAACRKRFAVYSYSDDLDADVTENERTPALGSYAIRVRDRVEADEELKNLSADDIKTRGAATETLLERLVHELKFFSEKREHLDIQNVTLATGSCGRCGGVPGVGWRGSYGRLVVDLCDPRDADGHLRSRAAVS